MEFKFWVSEFCVLRLLYCLPHWVSLGLSFSPLHFLLSFSYVPTWAYTTVLTRRGSFAKQSKMLTAVFLLCYD